MHDVVAKRKPSGPRLARRRCGGAAAYQRNAMPMFARRKLRPGSKPVTAPELEVVVPVTPPRARREHSPHEFPFAKCHPVCATHGCSQETRIEIADGDIARQKPGLKFTTKCHPIAGESVRAP